jgi:hypothetical protein
MKGVTVFRCAGNWNERTFMAATGELIRMMNYVDDIAATLRRINASLYLITGD